MKSKNELSLDLDLIYYLINKIRTLTNPQEDDLDRISSVICKCLDDYEIDSKDYLIWTNGYLHGLSSASKPINEQLIVVKQYLHDLDNERFPLKDLNGNDDDFTLVKYHNNNDIKQRNIRYGNDDDYNESLDIDQQSPDFYS